jgi:hypothetical protein
MAEAVPGAILRRYGPTVVFVSLSTLLVIYIFDLVDVRIDWVAISMIVVLLFIPYLRFLKRVEVANVGGVEMQSSINQTRELIEQIGDIETEDSEDTTTASDTEEDSSIEDDEDPVSEEHSVTVSSKRDFYPSNEYIGGMGGEIDDISDDIYRLLETNPRVALARLRMELEEAVRELLSKSNLDNTLRHKSGAYRSAVSQARLLTEQYEEVGNNFLESYMSVRSLCNSAIHGEEVKTEDAIEIVDLGLDLLRYLSNIEPLKPNRWYKIPNVGTGSEKDAHRPKYSDMVDGHAGNHIDPDKEMWLVRFYADSEVLDKISSEHDAEELTLTEATEVFNNSDVSWLPDAPKTPEQLSDSFRMG